MNMAGMKRGVIYSAVLHLMIALLVIFGLPRFFDREDLTDNMMIVDVVTIAEKTSPPPAKTREELPKPKPVEDKPPPPEAKPQPAPTPPPVPEVPQPQVAEKIPDPKPPEPKPEVKPPEPEPKPEVKKEPPKPPEPPQQMAKVVPPKKPTPPKPPQKQPKKEDFIDSILKNVAPTPKVAEKSDTKTPQKDTSPPSPAPPSLDQQVTISEIDAVKRQISECWNLPAGARDAKDLVVTIRATVAPDGRVQSARIDNPSRMADPFYRAAAESAQRAVLNPRCQPLKLPPHKYDQWRNLRLDFNPKDMIG